MCAKRPTRSIINCANFQANHAKARWPYDPIQDHILAICGFNVAILVGAFMAASRPLLGARRSVWLALVGVAV